MNNPVVEEALWIALTTASVVAALAWVGAATVARSYPTSFRYAAALLGCCHMMGACRAILIGTNHVVTDPGSTFIHLLTSVMCASVGICVFVAHGRPLLTAAANQYREFREPAREVQPAE